MRKLKLINSEQELNQIEKISSILLDEGYNASNSVIIAVSSDYSSIAAQILRHSLSDKGEICDSFSVDVPYPDEVWNQDYVLGIYNAFYSHSDLFFKEFKTPILVEAAVIRGGNYTFLIDWLKNSFNFYKNIVTTSLYENISSKFKSNFVGEYYDNEKEDLTFWWERFNNHWN